jgi:hypothetical protein
MRLGEPWLTCPGSVVYLPRRSIKTNRRIDAADCPLPKLSVPLRRRSSLESADWSAWSLLQVLQYRSTCSSQQLGQYPCPIPSGANMTDFAAMSKCVLVRVQYNCFAQKVPIVWKGRFWKDLGKILSFVRKC